MLQWIIAGALAVLALFSRAQASMPAPAPPPAVTQVVAAEPITIPTTEPAAVSAVVPTVRPAFTVCVVDEAGIGYDSAWAAAALSSDWNADVTVDCVAPTVLVNVSDFTLNGRGDDDKWCGYVTANEPGLVRLNAQCLWTNNFVWRGSDISGAYVFRVALDHEVGHVFGMPHGDADSVMYPVTVYMPTSEDQAQLAEAVEARENVR